jgi:hypothetical protein
MLEKVTLDEDRFVSDDFELVEELIRKGSFASLVERLGIELH